MRSQKRIFLLLLFCVSLTLLCKAQTFEVTPPSFALKTNFLSWATGTINIGGEARIANRYTLNLSAGYNPWTFSENRKWKHVSVMPELRYWTCEPFTGHFFGAHLLYAHYNAGNFKLPFDLFPGLESERWEGNMYGAGLSYGYSLYLSPRWSLEGTIGAGYIYLDHDRYECVKCGDLKGSSTTHYFGPTKAAISLIYILK